MRRANGVRCVAAPEIKHHFRGKIRWKHEHKQVEKKWQDIWDEAHCFEAENGSAKEKFRALVEFPYPSGQGLHRRPSARSYTALDIVARRKRMQGYNALSDGLGRVRPADRELCDQNHVHPAEVTKKNIARFKRQLKALGLSFDWSREINTTDPNYYKWTPVDLPAAVQARPGLQEGNERQLVYVLQVRAGE